MADRSNSTALSFQSSLSPIAKPESLENCNLDALLQALPGSVAILDAAGKLLRANRAWENLMFPGDWAPREGENYLAICEQVVGPGAEQTRALAEGIRLVISGKLPQFSQEYSFRQGEESRKWLNSHVASVQVCGPVRVVITHFDVTEHKVAEAALRESEERFRALADCIPQLASITSPDGRVEWYNQRWTEFTGYTAEQMQHLDWGQILDPASIPAISERWGRSIATGDPFEMELAMRGAGGDYRIFLSRALPLKGAEGEVVRWFATSTDITALKQTQKAYLETSSCLQALMKALPVGVLFSMDPNCEQVSGNPAATELLGGLSKDVDSQFFHQGREIAYTELPLFRAVRMNCEIPPTEIEILHADGQRWWTECWAAPIRHAAGEVVGGVAVLLDICERKREEKRLRESENRFKQLAKASFEGIIISENGIILEANEQFAHMHGCKREEAIGKPVADFLVPEDRDRVHQVVCSGKRHSAEYQNLRKDGSVYTVEANGRPIMWAGREARVSALRDITQRKRAEAERNSDVVFLNLVNSSKDLRDLCENTASFLKDCTGCDAVAICACDGRGRPWFASSGLAQEGVAFDQHSFGDFRMEEWSDAGEACLQSGSFPTPNQKFESVALIPFGNKKKRVGLVQLHSRHKGHFTPEIVSYCERLSDKLFIAVQKFQAQQALEKAKSELEAQVIERTVQLKKKNETLAAEILKKKTAYRSLEESELRLRTLSDNIPDGAIFQYICKAKKTGSYTYFSRGADQLFGFPSRKPIKDWSILESLIHPEDRKHYLREYCKATQALSFLDTEARIRTPDGRIKWMHWKAAPRLLPNGDVVWEGVVADQTKRKQAELGLKRAYRALNVLKECGEALVRAESDQELLASICKIIVDLGGAILAWVGIPEIGAGKPVRIVATAGEAEYLRNKQISWGKNKFSRVPAGRATRTRKIQVCHNLFKDPRMSAWREQAIKHGIAASISLPLLSDGYCLGTLNIYSGQPDSFNDEEVELLSRLAADLGYGIAALRIRAERAELGQELLRISEREKQRMAQELHDGLCQHLTGTAFLGSTLYQRLSARNAPEADTLKEICHYLNVGASEARSVAHGLYPVHPEPEGLMMALDKLSRTAQNLYSVRCQFLCCEPVAIDDQSTANHLFRIAQESLNNARKHGRAKRIQIRLQQSAKGISLSIQDNGLGIPKTAQTSKGLGMRIMRQRAETIGAQLSIQRAGKRGTLVFCFLPFASRKK